MMKLLITDTTLRDAYQFLVATRMKTVDMIPILEKVDKVGFHSLAILTPIRLIPSQGRGKPLYLRTISKSSLVSLVDSASVYDNMDPDSKFRRFLLLCSQSEQDRLAQMSGIDSRWVFSNEVNTNFLKLEDQDYRLGAKCISVDGLTDVVMHLSEMRPILARISTTELRLYTRAEYVENVKPALRKYLTKTAS